MGGWAPALRVLEFGRRGLGSGRMRALCVLALSTAAVHAQPAANNGPLIIEPVWNQLVSGQCQFTAILASATTMTLPNGTSLTGDRVVFTEEINPGGHYPYTGATSMDVQSNVSSYVITAEPIIPH